MATDYRQIFSDTVGKLKDQALNLAETTGVKDAYEKGADRAKSFGSATRLTLALNREYQELEKIYAEIGRLTVEQTAEPDGFFRPLFQRLEAQKRLIAEKEDELEKYKSVFEPHADTPDAEILDFEDIVNRTESDGRQ